MQDEPIIPIKERSPAKFKKILAELKNKGYKIKVAAILTEMIRINGKEEPQIVFAAIAEQEEVLLL